MITIKKINGNLQPFFTLVDDATNKRVGLVKGKNWLIKRQGWQMCNNPSYLTNHKNTGHYSKTSKCSDGDDCPSQNPGALNLPICNNPINLAILS